MAKIAAANMDLCKKEFCGGDPASLMMWAGWSSDMEG